MSRPFSTLGVPTLARLARALEQDSVVSPWDERVLARYVDAPHTAQLRSDLQTLTGLGMTGLQIAAVLDLLARERRAQQEQSDRLELVLSPPELDEVDARSTSAVALELFGRAEEKVLVVGYAFDEGKTAQTLFGTLANKLDTNPQFQVRVCVNIHRQYQDKTPPEALIRTYVQTFQSNIWPGARLPELYHFPPSVALATSKRASLHAKCIVVDERWSLITSANFTEAARERNIEAGVLVDNPHLSRRLNRQFDQLIQRGELERVKL